MDNSKTLSERIIAGREAEYRLKDDFLNQVFDNTVESLIGGIFRAPITDTDAVMLAKMELNGLMLVRRRIKALMEDGILAQAEQDSSQENDE